MAALHAAKLGEAADNVRQIREAFGEELDLCIEIHRRLSVAEAIVLASMIEPYRPMFYEDPISPENNDTCAQFSAGLGFSVVGPFMPFFIKISIVKIISAWKLSAVWSFRPGPCAWR